MKQWSRYPLYIAALVCGLLGCGLLGAAAAFHRSGVSIFVLSIIALALSVIFFSLLIRRTLSRAEDRPRRAYLAFLRRRDRNLEV